MLLIRRAGDVVIRRRHASRFNALSRRAGTLPATFSFLARMANDAPRLSLLDELDARQDRLLDELDRLNSRIEQVLRDSLGLRQDLGLGAQARLRAFDGGVGNRESAG